MSGDHLERLEAFTDAWQSAMDDDLTSDVIAVIDGKPLWESNLRAALDELKQLRAEREGGLTWEEWEVRILISGGAVSMDYEDETDARIRYRELVDHPEKVRRLVDDATSYPSESHGIELLCRTNWQGEYRVVDAAPQQPAPDGETT